MTGFFRGPICGETNPSFASTPGATGCNDQADPDNHIYIPDTKSSLGFSSITTGILLARKKGIALPSETKTLKPKDPFKPIKSAVFMVGNKKVMLYQYPFPRSTSLAFALEWILTNSIATLTDPKEIAYATAYGLLLTYYQEVSLFWHLPRKRFIAYTLKSETSTSYDLRISEGDLIFVAHTHPTKKDLPPSKRVSWRTSAPSPGDVKGFMPNQQYSIILHRDLQNNKTPHGFIYDRSNNIYRITKKGPLFKEVASQYLELETAAKTKAAKVGDYD